MLRTTRKGQQIRGGATLSRKKSYDVDCTIRATSQSSKELTVSLENKKYVKVTKEEESELSFPFMHAHHRFVNIFAESGAGVSVLV